MNKAIPILATILGVFVIMMLFVIVYVMFCYTVFIDNEPYKFWELRNGHDTENPSLTAVKSLDQESTVVGREVPGGVLIDGSSQEYLSALDESFIEDAHIDDANIDDTNIDDTGDDTEDDSLNRTLILQNLLPTSSVRKVPDPYSDNFINIGGIVVVVKCFQSLIPGDLLRIVKFSSKTNDDNYKFEDIMCSGIILNTLLEVKGNKVVLKFKNHEEELMKEFPLTCVSLESTLLSSL
ncbi:hypothetical protein CLIB1444_12S02344 [[Candida] jaroonii]|uniref:Uncharacterized protein n=1 Tax=[Candida] jaroonii TaxID=467808 RepID=A0ACA9YE44_9ASCO|nr:hypothetical protein CLIB1444_12S02344 [[Candida] jaroonii]